MGNNFKTVQEVKKWRNFSVDDKTYDLSHLDAQWIEYVDTRNSDKPTIYKFIVTYGFHCFTEKTEGLSEQQLRSLMYHSPNESRPFNFERYHLSKKLPAIIKDLGKQNTLVFHAGYGNYATVKLLNSKGIEVDYFIVFRVFRETKKLRIHVMSAYPKDESIGRRKKVQFFNIARNLLRGKKLPRPK